MVSRKKITLSRDSGESVLDQLLRAWGMNYSDFAKVIGVKKTTLRDYRLGRAGLKLSLPAVKSLDKLLKKVGLTIHDLPDDWILERTEERERISA